MKNHLFQVTKTTQGILDEWQAKAKDDENVWPYLSFSPYAEYKSCGDGNDWDNVFLMDETGMGVLQFSPDRPMGNHEASVSIWVLSCPSKKMTAGRLMMAVPKLAKRFGIKFICAGCHESNVDSRRVLTKRFGSPWGIKREGAWNGLLGRFEDTCHFRMLTEDWGKN